MRVCALCGHRDSIDLTDWDGRMVPACGVCLEPPDVPEGYEYEPADLAERFKAAAPGCSTDRTARNVIVMALQQLGEATHRDLADVLRCGDTESREYDLVGQHLRRMRKRGELESIDEVTPGKWGCRYRLTPGTDVIDESETPRARIVAEYQKGFEARQISDRLGISYSAVKASLWRARVRNEIPVERRKRVAACSMCNRNGHNARTCELKEAA